MILWSRHLMISHDANSLLREMTETQNLGFPERDGWCLLNRHEFLQSEVMFWAIPNETDLEDLQSVL